MGYNLKKLPGEPIVIFTGDKDYNLATDVAASGVDANKLMDGLDEDIVYINDLSRVSASVDGVMVGANESSRGDHPAFHHPRMKKLLFVTTDPLLKLAIHGLAAAIYGHIESQIVDTLDQALSLARKG